MEGTRSVARISVPDSALIRRRWRAGIAACLFLPLAPHESGTFPPAALYAMPAYLPLVSEFTRGAPFRQRAARPPACPFYNAGAAGVGPSNKWHRPTVMSFPSLVTPTLENAWTADGPYGALSAATGAGTAARAPPAAKGRFACGHGRRRRRDAHASSALDLPADQGYACGRGRPVALVPAMHYPLLNAFAVRRAALSALSFAVRFDALCTEGRGIGGIGIISRRPPGR